MSATEFNELLAGSSGFLKPLAYSLTRDHEAAKDLFQETVYKALFNREKYLDGTSVQAWMYTIMRNIFINDYRRAARGKRIFCMTAVMPVKQAPELLNNAECRIELKYLQTSISGLPEIFRFPFQLHWEGFKYNEIAEMLNEPLGTIKSRIHFARKILKHEILSGKAQMN